MLLVLLGFGVFFWCVDGVGCELWFFDGIDVGIVCLVDMFLGSGFGLGFGIVFLVVNGYLLFNVVKFGDFGVMVIWVSDGMVVGMKIFMSFGKSFYFSRFLSSEFMLVGWLLCFDVGLYGELFVVMFDGIFLVLLGLFNW